MTKLSPVAKAASYNSDSPPSVVDPSLESRFGSIITRGVRFYLVATLLYFWGDRARPFEGGCQRSLVPRACSGYPPRQDLASVAHEAAQARDFLVITMDATTHKETTARSAPSR